MTGRISYRGTQTKNVADFPQFKLSTYLVFDVELDEGVAAKGPTRLNDEMTNEIISKVKGQIIGKKRQVLIDLFKFPKVKVTVISEGPFVTMTLEEAKKMELPIEYIEAVEMLEKYDNQNEAAVTFLNMEQDTVVHQVVKL